MTDIKHALENIFAKFIINTFPDAVKLDALAPQCNHVVITEQDAADVKALHEKLNHENNNDDNAFIVLHSNNRELKD